MAKSSTIKIENRDYSRKPSQLRAIGKIPSTIYGPDQSPISVQIDSKDFKNTLKGDKTTIVNLKGKEATYNVLPKNIQQDPRTGEVLNIEFYRVKSGEKMKVTVPVELINESPAARAGGTLWNPITEIEVECMPDNIPSNIQIDISRLETFEDSVSVGEVQYPDGISPVSSLDSIVVKINAPKNISLQIPESPEMKELT